MRKNITLLVLSLVLLSGCSQASSFFVQEIPIHFEGIDAEIKGVVVEGKAYIPMQECFDYSGFDWYYEDGRVYVFTREEELDEYNLWDCEVDEYDLWDYEEDWDDWDSEDEQDYEYDFDDHYWEWEEDEMILESWFVEDYEYIEIEFIDEELIDAGAFAGVLLDNEVYIGLRDFLERAGLDVEYEEGEVVISFPFNF